MSNRRGWSLIATNVLVVVVVVTACRTQPDDGGQMAEATPTVAESALAEVEDEPPTVEVTRIIVETEIVEITPAPQLQETEPKQLVVCMGEEPEFLYPYGRSRLSKATNHVLQGIYESMFTTLAYDYQPRGIEKMPTLADGDAVISQVTVWEGDRVLDINENVVVLGEGVKVKDSAGEIVEFDGTSITMPQLMAEFTLKPLVWSDGRPVTADDSVYSYE